MWTNNLSCNQSFHRRIRSSDTLDHDNLKEWEMETTHQTEAVPQWKEIEQNYVEKYSNTNAAENASTNKSCPVKMFYNEGHHFVQGSSTCPDVTRHNRSVLTRNSFSILCAYQFFCKVTQHQTNQLHNTLCAVCFIDRVMPFSKA